MSLGSHRLGLGVLGVLVLLPTMSACVFLDDGARLMRSAISRSAPIVRELPIAADDATLARAAAQSLDGADQSLLARAREIAQDDDVKLMVKVACNLSGLSTADPNDVAFDLQSIAGQAALEPDLSLLYEDASATADRVRSETGGMGVMTSSAALSIAIFQKVYC